MLAKKKKKRSPKFNPSKYHKDVMKLPRHDMADVATNLKGQLHAAKNAMDERAKDALDITGGVSVGGLVGVLQGYLESKAATAAGGYAALQAGPTWGEGNVPDDPRKLMNVVPIDVLVAAGFTGATLLNLGGAEYKATMRSVTTGAVAAVVANYTKGFGQKLAEKA